MPPVCVKPYVKQKEQQALLPMHAVRQLIGSKKTQILNVIRGHFPEFGQVIGNRPVAAIRFGKASRAGGVF